MRNRRTALGIGLLLLLCGFIRFVLFPLEMPGMGAQALDAGEAEVLMEGRKEAAEEILQGLVFAGEELPWDRASGTFYLPLDMDERAWEDGIFTAAEGGARIYLLDNPLEDDKQEAIRQGKSYRLLAVKGDQHAI